MRTVTTAKGASVVVLTEPDLEAWASLTENLRLIAAAAQAFCDWIDDDQVDDLDAGARRRLRELRRALERRPRP